MGRWSSSEGQRPTMSQSWRSTKGGCCMTPEQKEEHQKKCEKRDPFEEPLYITKGPNKMSIMLALFDNGLGDTNNPCRPKEPQDRGVYFWGIQKCPHSDSDEIVIVMLVSRVERLSNSFEDWQLEGKAQILGRLVVKNVIVIYATNTRQGTISRA